MNKEDYFKYYIQGSDHYLIQRIDTFKEIFSKYKEIIGSDINVGSIGGKE